jgi:hypothetical protein
MVDCIGITHVRPESLMSAEAAFGLVASWADMILPPFFALLFWWLLLRKQKRAAAFLFAYSTVLALVATFVFWLVASDVIRHSQFSPFAEFYFYYFFVLVALAGLFLLMYAAAFRRTGRASTLSEVLFAMLFAAAVNAIPLLLLSGLFGWGSLYTQWWKLAALAIVVGPLAILYPAWLITSRKLTPGDTGQPLARRSVFLLIALVVAAAAGTVQVGYSWFIPPRLAANAWLLEADFGTGLSAHKLKKAYRKMRGSFSRSERSHGLGPLLDIGFRLVDLREPGDVPQPYAVYERGTTRVSISDASSITPWEPILWADSSEVGLPADSLRAPVTPAAFIEKYGKGRSRVNPVDLDYPAYVFMREKAEDTAPHTTMSYETGTLGLDFMAVTFREGRLVAAFYFPRHQDVISSWEVPWWMGNPIVSVIILALLLAFIVMRLSEEYGLLRKRS